MNTPSEAQQTLRLTMEAAIRLALLAVLVYMCARIVTPFALPVLWGAILAIAFWPMCSRLTRALGGRQKLAAGLITLLALLVLLVPGWLLADSIVRGVSAAGSHLTMEHIVVPDPPERVTEWPVVGEWLGKKWTAVAADPPAALAALKPYLVALGKGLLSAIAEFGIGMVLFAFSLLLAGVFMAFSKGSARTALAVAKRVAGPERGHELVDLSAKTISSVMKGVVGVAAIQALMATVGMFVAGVPYAGAWGLLILVLAIVQLPTIVVLLPIVFYVSTITGTFGTIAFLAWALIVGASDNILKPLLMGRGVEVPMLVILIGSIGGMLAWSVLGLFVGAVVLAIGYQLTQAWLHEPAVEAEAAG